MCISLVNHPFGTHFGPFLSAYRRFLVNLHIFVNQWNFWSSIESSTKSDFSNWNWDRFHCVEGAKRSDWEGVQGWPFLRYEIKGLVFPFLRSPEVLMIYKTITTGGKALWIWGVVPLQNNMIHTLIKSPRISRPQSQVNMDRTEDLSRNILCFAPYP